MSRVTTAIPAFAIGVAAATLSAGCSAGQHTQTAVQVAAVSGANQTIEMRDGDRVVGRIALRDLMIQYRQKGYPAGVNAPLAVRIFNDSPNPVKLCDATSETGEIGKANGSAAACRLAPSPTPGPRPRRLRVPHCPRPPPTPSATASPSADTPPPHPHGGRTAGQERHVSVRHHGCPRQGYMLLLPGQAQYLQIQKLQEKLEPGGHVRVLFQFEDAKGKQWRTEPLEMPMALPGTPAAPGQQRHRGRRTPLTPVSVVLLG